MGLWPHFLELQILARKENVAAKESLKLTNARKKGYVRVVDVKSLTCYFSLTKGE